MTNIHILGIPFDEKSSYKKGAAEGPQMIRYTLNDTSSNMYTETDVDLEADVSMIDGGDITIDGYDSLLPNISQVLKPGEKYIFLGGDHSITYPLVKATNSIQPSFDLLLFDAHTDLYDQFEGDKYSHACPFARIMEEGLCKRLLQIGIRTVTPHQKEQADKFGVEIIQMKNIHLMSEVTFERPLYISIDLDAFDPAHAPGVSHHEPGGLTARQVVNFLHSIKVPIVSADIVELNPKRDHKRMTAALAAKLLKELCGIMALND